MACLLLIYIVMANDSSNIDPKILQGIEYFEQMLQMMPDDRQALEFLCVAYEQVGESEKRRKALIALAGVLLKEGDLESAESIGERLESFEQADAQEIVQKIRLARNPSLVIGKSHPSSESVHAPSDSSLSVGTVPTQPGSAGATSAGTVPTQSTGTVPTQPDASVRQTAIKAEVNLVQNLSQAQVIDDSATGFVLQRLSEYANAPGLFLISALSILEKENPALGEAAAAYVADTANAPPIPVDAFTFTEELLKLIPERTMRMRGVLPFGKLQDAVLVATLNPMDQALRQEIELAVGAPCIFYLAPPRAIDELLERIFSETAAKPTPEPQAPTQSEAV